MSPNGWSGRTGRITAVSNRNFVNVRKQRGRVANESNERKRPHPSERIFRCGGLVFLPFEPEQEGEEQHEHDLDAFGRKRSIQVGHHGGKCSVADTLLENGIPKKP